MTAAPTRSELANDAQRGSHCGCSDLLPSPIYQDSLVQIYHGDSRERPARITMDSNISSERRSEPAQAGSLDAVVSLGDYVLATKYSDCDPQDPWRVGFVVRIIRDKRGETYIIGEQDGTWKDFREYRHAKKITHDEGKAWLEANGAHQPQPPTTQK